MMYWCAVATVYGDLSIWPALRRAHYSFPKLFSNWCSADRGTKTQEKCNQLIPVCPFSSGNQYTQGNNNKCKLWNCLFIFYNGCLSAGFPILHSTSELLCPVNTCCCHNMHAWVEKKESLVKNSFYFQCDNHLWVLALYLDVYSSWLKIIQVNLQTAP